MNNKETSIGNLSISVNKAIEWIRNWRNGYMINKGNDRMPIDLKGFLVSKSDFMHLLGND